MAPENEVNDKLDMFDLAIAPRRPSPPAVRRSEPTIALALGCGAARGLSLIPVLEALDELGVRPTRIAGTSIGAIVGAAYAAGFSGAALRDHALSAFLDKRLVLARLIETRVGRFVDLFGGSGNPIMIDSEKLLDRFWPKPIPEMVEDLAIPFTAIAADLYAREEVRLSSGPLKTAVAASMAIPGMIRPVERDGLVLIDGGVANPVPVDVVSHDADIVIAVNLNGAPLLKEAQAALPTAYQAVYSAFLVMEHRLVLEKFARTPPTLHLTPDVGQFSPLDFLKVPAILAAAEPMKELTKQRLGALLEVG